MRTLVCLFLLLACYVKIFAQTIPPFNSIRFSEDYSFLKNDSLKNWYEKLKYNQLSKKGRAFISIGGEIRYQFFRFHHEDWGDAPDDNNGFILTRYLGHADFHAGKSFRTFVQLQSSLANDRISPSPVDENLLDLHQAFFDISIPINKANKIVVRLGRQEMAYGSQRLVALRDGPNNRQSFDAGKLIYSGERLKTDVFYAHFVKSKPAIFDDGFNKDTKFWGSYTVINHLSYIQNIDLYYLGIWKASAFFDDGEAKELRHSIGSRIWNNIKGFRYDIEGLYQFGKFGGKQINAWTVSINSGIKFNELKLKPELGIKAELISGDRFYDDKKLQTFNPLFPRGNYFGLAALIGPSNLLDLHPSVSLEITKKLLLNADYDAFWRFSENDGIYSPNVSLTYSGKNIPDKLIGQQYSTDIVYTANNFLYFRVEFTWFNAGSFLKAAGTGKDIIFTAFTTQLKF
ncbi:alginate export family protein [Lacibacter sediminis]|uniref:Alginate export family protein n=1 Tax=Lacibacter sediminis TaxID=2760713 RepID=A0A7G5XK98_9BACT|nr:alginate export family protein [Lacibacter sediminis]QNA45901.1 alginate export family protein [Lacibacter sediminis]